MEQREVEEAPFLRERRMRECAHTTAISVPYLTIAYNEANCSIPAAHSYREIERGYKTNET